MTEENRDATDQATRRLAAGLQALYDSLPGEERALLAVLLEQAAAHPDAILRRATDALDVKGFNAGGWIAIGGLGGLPPPPGGLPPGGSGAGSIVYNYYLQYPSWR